MSRGPVAAGKLNGRRLAIFSEDTAREWGKGIFYAKQRSCAMF